METFTTPYEASVSKLVDYYFSPISPWTYLGHPRLVAMLKKHGAQINVKPVDLGGKIFPISGGLPLPQRAPQRQAYRLAELARWRDFLKMPLTIKPKYFPAPGDLSACLIIAAKADGEDAALRLSWGILNACWAEERNTGDVETLQAIAQEQGLDGAALLVSVAGHSSLEKIRSALIEAGASVRSSALVGSHATRYTVPPNGAAKA